MVALLLPGLALAAAYNDVSISGSTNLSVNSITINVSSATLNQISVGATTFSVALGPNSTVFLAAPNLNQMALSVGGSDFLASSVCDGSASSMTLTAPANAATTTITITPSSTLCTTSSSGGSTSGSSSGGGGGGGIASTLTPSPLATSASPATSNANLTASQKSALVVQLTAQLNTLLAQLAVLQGRPVPNANAVANANANASFKRDIQTGSTGSDVKALQAYLNGHGSPVAANGAGSSGNETTKFGNATKAALIKFQKSVGITPATGYLGAKTRAYIASHP